jgi:hypothetical protein
MHIVANGVATSNAFPLDTEKSNSLGIQKKKNVEHGKPPSIVFVCTQGDLKSNTPTNLQLIQCMYRGIAHRQLPHHCAAVHWLGWPQASIARQRSQLQLETTLRTANGSRHHRLRIRMAASGARIISCPRMKARGNGSPSPTGSSFWGNRRLKGKHPRKGPTDLSPLVHQVPIWAFLGIVFPRPNVRTERIVPKAALALLRWKGKDGTCLTMNLSRRGNAADNDTAESMMTLLYRAEVTCRCRCGPAGSVLTTGWRKRDATVNRCPLFITSNGFKSSIQTCIH